MSNLCDGFQEIALGAVPGIQAIFNFPYGHIVMAYIGNFLNAYEQMEECFIAVYSWIFPLCQFKPL